MSDAVEPLSLNDLLALSVQTIGELTPDGWDASLSPVSDDPYLDRRTMPDALLNVEAPDGQSVSFAAIARMTTTGRDVPQLIARLRGWGLQHRTTPLLVARYLSSTVREQLSESGASYIDATGNIEVSSPAPAIAISRRGLARDPWRRSTTRDGLFGESSARTVRALCEFTTPLQISRLVELSGTSTGATYRTLDLLFEEKLAEKSARGWIESVDWKHLLKRWASDRLVSERRFVRHYRLPDGVDDALVKLAKEESDSYVLGGPHAADAFTSSHDARSMVVHSENSAALAARLKAEPARNFEDRDLTIHVRGIAASSARATRIRKVTIATPCQAYADLMLIDARKPMDKLLRAMSKSEERWRGEA